MFIIGPKTRLTYILRTINASNLKLEFFEILRKSVYRISLYRATLYIEGLCIKKIVIKPISSLKSF